MSNDITTTNSKYIGELNLKTGGTIRIPIENGSSENIDTEKILRLIQNMVNKIYTSIDCNNWVYDDESQYYKNNIEIELIKKSDTVFVDINQDLEFEDMESIINAFYDIDKININNGSIEIYSEKIINIDIPVSILIIRTYDEAN